MRKEVDQLNDCVRPEVFQINLRNDGGGQAIGAKFNQSIIPDHSKRSHTSSGRIFPSVGHELLVLVGEKCERIMVQKIVDRFSALPVRGSQEFMIQF